MNLSYLHLFLLLLLFFDEVYFTLIFDIGMCKSSLSLFVRIQYKVKQYQKNLFNNVKLLAEICHIRIKSIF